MKLSAPIYRLKHQAKVLSRKHHIPLNKALDRVALQEGFSSWSLLVAQISPNDPANALFALLDPGDLVLLGGRPGHGKTLMGVELIVKTLKQGRRGMFFTLEYNESDVLHLFQIIKEDPDIFEDQFVFDNSDTINSDYIIERLASAPRGSVVLIDYLQLLDQKRENPELMAQVQALKVFARNKGVIIVFLSQIDRSYDPSQKSCPDLRDVRLPNPLDLKLFNKTCFLNDGEVQIGTAEP